MIENVPKKDNLGGFGCLKDVQECMHCNCTSMDVEGKKVYHTYMIMKWIMYCNNVDKQSDNVCVTFSNFTQRVFMHTNHTQIPSSFTLTQTTPLVPHINIPFAQSMSIVLTKCISILMLQINSHAKKWRFTS
jgi:hypothetical protein